MDYNAHVYCTASPILDPVPNEGLLLVTGSFCYLIASLHVESDVHPLVLPMKWLSVKALRPYLLPSSTLQSLLASEDLTSFQNFLFWLTFDCLMDF